MKSSGRCDDCDDANDGTEKEESNEGRKEIRREQRKNKGRNETLWCQHANERSDTSVELEQGIMHFHREGDRRE